MIEHGTLGPAMSDEAIEAWQQGYERWQHYHALAFGWNGPEGSVHAHQLFMYWDKLFFSIVATEQELCDATDWAVGLQETFEAKWEAHYSIVRTRILAERGQANPVAPHTAKMLEEAGPRNVTARRIRNELAEKMKMRY